MHVQFDIVTTLHTLFDYFKTDIGPYCFLIENCII